MQTFLTFEQTAEGWVSSPWATWKKWSNRWKKFWTGVAIFDTCFALLDCSAEKQPKNIAIIYYNTS